MKKLVWITGAGKGIGRALALRMASEGWQVAASARTVADLQSLVQEGNTDRIHAFALDVTDLTATARVIKDIEASLGNIALAVLNAGTHRPMGAENFDVSLVRDLLETNVMGTVNGLSLLIPKFMARGEGHIGVVASVAGYRGLPTSAAYGATKAALINMCEALEPELKNKNVALSLINPGFVETPLTDKNDFPMPFLISAEKAADYIYKGLQSRAFEIVFPGKFAVVMKCLRFLPNRLFLALASRMVRS